MVLCTNKLD